MVWGSPWMLKSIPSPWRCYHNDLGPELSLKMGKLVSNADWPVGLPRRGAGNLLLLTYESAMEVEPGFSKGEPFQAQPFQALPHNSASFSGASRRFTLGTSDSG